MRSSHHQSSTASATGIFGKGLATLITVLSLADRCDDRARARTVACAEHRIAFAGRKDTEPMPIIKPRTNRVRIVRHICRLQEPNRDLLTQYARFIGDTPDYVLNQLIDGTLGKDRDFIAWRTEHAVAADVPATPHEHTARRTRGEQTV